MSFSNDNILELTVKLFYQTIFHRVINPGLNEVPEPNLTLVQLNCLRYVYLHPGPSVGGIATGLKISDAASAKLIDRLVKRDLLTREEDPVDRRVLIIKLTPKGERCIIELHKAQTRHFQEIIGRMPAEAVEKLQAGMTAFLKAALVTKEQIDDICLHCGWEHLPNCPGNLRYQELTGENKRNY